MSELDDIKNFHDLKKQVKHLEYCISTLTAWLVSAQVFGHHDFHAMERLLNEKNHSNELNKGE